MDKMREIIKFLFSDEVYMLLLALFGAYAVSQEKYPSAYIAIAIFSVVAIKREVRSKSE